MSQDIRVLVVDDEPILRFHLQKMLTELWPEAEVVATAGSGDEALTLVPVVTPDVVFLDIKMPGISGLETASRLRDQAFQGQIVFVTAYDEFALQAFEKEAIDYVLKPVSEERLLKTIQRLQQQHRQEPKIAELDTLQRLIRTMQPENSWLGWIKASRGEVIEVIAVEEVLCFLAEDKYTTVVTSDGEAIIRKPIKELEAELNPNVFWRVHRSVIVNAHRIDKVSRELNGHYQITMKGMKRVLPVSRNYQGLFKQM